MPPRVSGPARRPLSEDDLDDHSVIAYGPRHLAPIPQLGWPLMIGRDGRKPREPIAEVNTIKGVMRLCEAGLGIAGLPDYVARENPNLLRILPEVSGPDFETYLIYPEELRGSRRVAAFASFIIEEARRWEN